MRSTNNKLLALAEAAELDQEGMEETAFMANYVQELVSRWYWLNLARAAMPAVGAVLGAIAVVRL